MKEETKLETFAAELLPELRKMFGGAGLEYQEGRKYSYLDNGETLKLSNTTFAFAHGTEVFFDTQRKSSWRWAAGLILKPDNYRDRSRFYTRRKDGKVNLKKLLSNLKEMEDIAERSAKFEVKQRAENAENTRLEKEELKSVGGFDKLDWGTFSANRLGGDGRTGKGIYSVTVKHSLSLEDTKALYDFLLERKKV